MLRNRLLLIITALLLALTPRAQAQPILREWDIYRLNPAYPLTCDAWDLDHALEEARSARDPRARRKALQRAAELTTGTFLQGFYASWADELQARTRDRVEKCLLDLGAQCAEAGEAQGHLCGMIAALLISACMPVV